jgi:NAD(P)-dependent dehydrogenase (short-subunit alcohol dehydrogenase family)
VIEDLVRGLAAPLVRQARGLPVIGGLVRPVLGPGPRLELDGKVVFVTGAGRGLGAEIARQAYAKGAFVALVGRRATPLRDRAKALGPRAAAFPADVTDTAALRRAAEATLARFGGIDVVVANAGVAPPSQTVLSIDPDAFERTVEIDLLGQWRTVRATLPAVIERQGHVLLVASVYAFFNGVLNAPYAVSKAGLEQLARALRVELAAHGASAGVAYLGFVDTDMAAEAFARPQVAQARDLLPAFATRPITVGAAARAVLEGIERRAGHVAAPWWVPAMLATRGLVGELTDEILLASRDLARLIRQTESESVPVQLTGDHAPGSGLRSPTAGAELGPAAGELSP